MRRPAPAKRKKNIVIEFEFAKNRLCKNRITTLDLK
jgi:hypothetical protein